MKKINVITLGCSKNTVDSEHLMAQLAAAGYTVTHDSDRTDAKVVVINTCGFIGDAKQESIDMILRAAAAKNAGKIERLFVVGCLSERYADELRAEIPEVDDYFGARTWDGIVRALGASEDPALATERRLTTPKHYAYLKISEGCNWKCGYCAIPLIRGGHVSVPMEELEEEARKLAGQGVRELMVIAQDTTYYGIDLYGRRMLAELLRRLCRIDGIEWVRLHYAYPAGFPDEVIEAMASEPKICKYLDIPFQHISDAQLASMHRRHTKAEAMELIGRLRGAIPDLALRTTLLALIDADAAGFLPLQRAYAIPKDDPGRAARLADAAHTACLAPLAMLEHCEQVALLLPAALSTASPLLRSDVGCAAALCSAAAEAAELNVLVNTGLLAPDDRAATEARAARLRATVVQCFAQTADAVRAALRGEG